FKIRNNIGYPGLKKLVFISIGKPQRISYILIIFKNFNGTGYITIRLVRVYYDRNNLIIVYFYSCCQKHCKCFNYSGTRTSDSEYVEFWHNFLFLKWSS